MLAALNVQAHSSTPAATSELLKSEIKRWGDVVDKAGIPQQYFPHETIYRTLFVQIRGALKKELFWSICGTLGKDCINRPDMCLASA